MAVAIAERARARLKLVLVHKPSVMMEPGPAYAKVELALQKADREYLKNVTARVRERLGRAVSSAMIEGTSVVQTLSVYMKELGAELVIMTTHGRGGVRRAWLGSVADQLIRGSEIPVIVIRPGEKEARVDAGFKEIVVALDGSPLAEAALEPAMAVARLWDSEIFLMQVVEPVILTDSAHLTFPSGYSDMATAIRREAAQDYIQDVAERLRESGVRATGAAVVGGAVSETIIDLAAPERISLMAVATHGRGGLKRLLLGSVADKLVRGAKVPVLVVRPAGRRARRKSGESNVAVSAGVAF
jgi:nucleotide-binding universal stress UspA family protein